MNKVNLFKTLQGEAGDKIAVSDFPWLKGRDSVDAKPKYLVVARCSTSDGTSVVTIHKAGEPYVVNYTHAYVLSDPEMIVDMDSKQVDLLRWIVDSEKEDFVSKVIEATKNK